MKKSIFTIFLIFNVVSTLSAQDISTVLPSMPENLIFGLDAAARDKLLANPEDTAEIVVERSGFGTLSGIKRRSISADYIELQTSGSGSIQIKLLPLINDSKIICVVKTVCGKACDSRIRFYTAEWAPITRGDLFPKVDKDIFIAANADRNSQEFRNACAALDMNPVVMTLSADSTSLEISYDIENYLTDEDYEKIKPYLIENPKKYLWDKLSFKPE